MNQIDLFNAIAAKAAAPATTNTAPLMTNSPARLNSLEQLGYNAAAARDTLSPEDFAKSEYSNISQDLSLEEQAALGRGMDRYATDAHSMDSADLIDHGQTLAGSYVEGVASGVLDIAAMAVGIPTDAALGMYNKFAQNQGLPQVEHNALGLLMEGSHELSAGLGNIFRNSEEQAYNLARAARSAAQEEASARQYQQDLDHGMSEVNATFRETLRDLATGASNALRDATAVTDTAGSVAGVVTAAGGVSKLLGTGTRKILKELRDKQLKSAYKKERASLLNQAKQARGSGDDTFKDLMNKAREARTNFNAAKAAPYELSSMAQRGINAVALGATEAGGSVGESAKQIDAMSDQQLLNQSPEFKGMVQQRLDSGQRLEDALAGAREDLKRNAAYIEAATGGGAALLAGAMMDPLGKIASKATGAKDIISKAMGASAYEAAEEAFTGLGQGVGTNLAAQQTYNPEERLTKGIGFQAGEGLVGGAIAGGGINTLANVVNGSQIAANKLKESFTDDSTKAAETLASIDPNTIETKTADVQPEAVKEETIQDEVNPATEEKTEVKVNAVVGKDGRTSLVYDNPSLTTPLKASDSIAEAYIPDENARSSAFSSILAANTIVDSMNKAKTDEDRYKFAHDLVTVNDNALDNWIKSAHLTESYFKTTGKRPDAFNDVATLLVGSVLIDPSRKPVLSNIPDPKEREYLEGLINAAAGMAVNVDKARKFLAARTEKAIKNQDMSKESVSQVTQNLGTFIANYSIDDEKLISYKNKLNETYPNSKEALTFNAIYDLLSNSEKVVASEAGNQNISAVNKNLTTTSQKGSDKISMYDIASNIGSAIVDNRKEYLKDQLTKLQKLALTRVSKFAAVQQSATTGSSFDNVEYVSVSPNTGDLYYSSVYAGSGGLYRALYNEQQAAVDAFNAALYATKLNFSDIASSFKEVKAMPELKNTYKIFSTRREKPQPTNTTPHELVNSPFKWEDYNFTPPTREGGKGIRGVIEEIQKKEAATVSQLKAAQDQAKQPQAQPEQASTPNTVAQEQQQQTTVPESKVAQETASTPVSDIPPATEQQAPVVQEQPTKAEPKKNKKAATKAKEKKAIKSKEQTPPVDSTSDETSDLPLFSSAPNMNVEEDTSIPQPQNQTPTEPENKVDTADTNEPEKNEESEDVDTSSGSTKPAEPTKPSAKQETKPDTKKETTKDKDDSGISEEEANKFYTSDDLDKYVTNSNYTISDDPIEHTSIPKGASDILHKKIQNLRIRSNILRSRVKTILSKRSLLLDDYAFSFNVYESFSLWKSNKKSLREFLQDSLEKAAALKGNAEKSLAEVVVDFNRFNRGFLTGIFKQSSNKSLVSNLRVDDRRKITKDVLKAKVAAVNDKSNVNLQSDLNKLDAFLDSFQIQMDSYLNGKVNGTVVPNLNFSGEKNKSLLDSLRLPDAGGNFKSMANWLLGVKLQTKENTDNNTDQDTEDIPGIDKIDQSNKLDFNESTTERLITALTVMDPKGELHFNRVALYNMGMAMLAVQQEREEAGSLGTYDEIAKDLNKKHGVTSEVFVGMDQKTYASLANGVPLDSIINSIRKKWMDYMGLRNNDHVSMSYDGNALATTFAQLALMASLAQGHLVNKTIFVHKVKNTETDAENAPEYIYKPLPYETSTLFTTNANEQRKFLQQYGGELVPISTVVPASVLYNAMDMQPEAENSKVSFKTLALHNAINEIHTHYQELDVVYDYNELKSYAPEHKLRSDAPLTKNELTAIHTRMAQPYYLIEGVHQIYQDLGIDGILALNDIVYDDGTPVNGNFNILRSKKGREINLRNEYDLMMARAIKARAADPNNPRMYVRGTQNRAGRYQEEASYTTQGSKLLRNGFSNVKHPIDLTDPDQLDGYMRAQLQVVGVKVKKLHPEAVREKFAKLVSALESDPEIKEIITKGWNGKNSLEVMLKVVNLYQTSLDSPIENVPILIGGFNSFIKYYQASHVKGEQTFINNLPLEFDGSCNGFANSAYVISPETEFTPEYFATLARSQMDTGFGDVVSPEMVKLLRDDNYTQNAVSTQNKILKMLENIVKAGYKYTTVPTEEYFKLLKNKKNLSPQDTAKLEKAKEERKYFPQYNFYADNKFNNPESLVKANPYRLAIGTLNVLDLVFGYDFKFNSETYKSSAKNQDFTQLDGALKLTRIMAKLPTTSINYGQGKNTSINSFMDIFKDAISLKFSSVVENPSLPIHVAFFKQEIDTGAFTKEDAFKAYYSLVQNLQLIVNVGISSKDSATTEYRITSRQSFSRNKKNEYVPINWPMPKSVDDVPTDDSHIMFFRDISFEKSIFNTPQLKDNIATYFAKPLFDAIDESRTRAYIKFTKKLVLYSALLSNVHGTVLRQKLESQADNSYHAGSLPSRYHFNTLKQWTEQRFPTILETTNAAIDLAADVNIEVRHKNKNKSHITGRTVSNQVVLQGPDKGSPVMSSFHTTIDVKSKAANGVAPMANTTISMGDGVMQTMLFNALRSIYGSVENAIANGLAAVDRYDGVDTNPAFHKIFAELINKSAYDVGTELPVVAFTGLVETFKDNVQPYLDQPGTDKAIEVITNVLNTLMFYDQDFKKDYEGYLEEDQEEFTQEWVKENANIFIPKLKQLFSGDYDEVKEMSDASIIKQTVLLSLPTTMNHMSTGPTGYTHIDPRDSFEVHRDKAIVDQFKEIADEANRRVDIVKDHLDDIYDYIKANPDKTIEDLLDSGTIPIYENNEAIHKEDKDTPIGKAIAALKKAKANTDPNEIKGLTLVATKPNPLARTIPNTRGNNIEVATTAPLFAPPKRAKVEVDQQKSVSTSTSSGRLDNAFFDQLLSDLEKKSANKNASEVLSDVLAANGGNTFGSFAPEDRKKFLGVLSMFINSNLARNTSIKIYNSKEHFRKTNDLGIDNVSALSRYAFYIKPDNGLAPQIVILKDAFNSVPIENQGEILLHEIIHSTIGTAIIDSYNNKNDPRYLAVRHLFMIQKTFAAELHYYADKGDTTAKEILSSMDTILVDKRAKDLDPIALNEFIAHMLTDPKIISFSLGKAKSRYTGTIGSSLQSIFKAFFTTISKLLGFTTKKAFTDFLDLYGKTAVLAAEISNQNNALDLVQDTISGSAIISNYPDRTAKNPRVASTLSKIEDLMDRLSRREVFQELKEAKLSRALSNREALVNLVTNISLESNLALEPDEILLAASLANIYSTDLSFNSSAQVDAYKLRDIIVSKLKPEHFLAEDEDSSKMPVAKKRYNYLLGITRDKKNVTALGLFMGLAASSDIVRGALNKATGSIKSKELDAVSDLNIYDNKVDQALAEIGERCLQHISTVVNFNLSDIKGYSSNTATSLIDQLNDSLVTVKKDLAALSIPADFVSSLDSKVLDFANNKLREVFDSDKFRALLESDSKFVRFIGTALHLSIPTLLKDSDPIYKAHKEKILELVNSYSIKHPSFLSNLLGSLYKELSSADKNADAVYAFEKQNKALIQANRSNWREVVPRKLKDMFLQEKVSLTKKDAADLNKVILDCDLGALTDEEIDDLFKHPETIDQKYLSSSLTPKMEKEVTALAEYLALGKFSQGMYRNAEAILTVNTSPLGLEYLDKVITLRALQYVPDALNRAREIYLKAPEAFLFTVAQQRSNTADEVGKSERVNYRINVFKGYYPKESLSSTNVRIIPKSDFKQYELLGYKQIGESSDNNYIYIQSDINPLNTYNQGAIQSIISNTGGINLSTGWMPSNLAYVRITEPKTTVKLAEDIANGRINSKECYLPIIDSEGVIRAYEKVVNTEMYSNIKNQTDFSINLGNWKGRQIEEGLAEEVNKQVVDLIKNQYKQATPAQREKQFVDLVALARKDPIVKDALYNIPIETIKYITNGQDYIEQLYVRKDLVEDVIGRRQASVIDLATGQSRLSPKTQRVLRDFLVQLGGKNIFRYLYQGEQGIKYAVSSIRSTIVVRSGIVALGNLAGNFMNLSMRGVPPHKILTQSVQVVKELEHYNKSRQKQAILEMEINAELGKINMSPTRLNILKSKLKAEQEFVNSLHFSGDLLKAGEYNTIADLGEVEDDILLSTGKWGEYLESQVNKLPKSLKIASKQLYLAKDTAIYRALEKSTQYGDFIAKAILYKHFIEKGDYTKEEALSKVRYEFVNYDMLAGRTREYLENIGLIWFYNYKLRVLRTAFSLVKENPVHVLLNMSIPLPATVGTALTDNVLVKLLSGGLDNSVGLKIFDLPWITSNLWYTLFGPK